VEEALRDSLERFEFANRAAFNAIWDWNLRTDELGWNENFQMLFGYRADEIEPGIESWTHRIHPEDLDRVKTSIHAAIDSGKRDWFDHYRFRRKDGSYAHIDDRGYISRDAVGRPVRMIGAMQDVTERKRAEEALCEARDQLERRVLERTSELREAMSYNRNLIEASVDPLVMIGPEGKITDVNRATENITGRSRRELIGSDFSNYFIEPQKARAIYRHVFETGIVRDYELLLRHKDGHATPVQYNASVYRDEFGAVIGVFAAARDMTEVKNTEANLVQSKQLLDKTGKLARVGGWEIDLKTNTLSWTDMVYEIHEVERDFQPTVETGINFYAPEAIPVISEAVRLAIEEGRPFDHELQLITAKKKRLWVRAIGGPIHENGQVIRVGGAFQDINERKLADDELKRHRDHLEELVQERTRELAEAVKNLERSNVELEQFAYVASHDLQEPLRMVSSYTQLLAQRYEGQLDEKAKKYIDYAVDGSVRMQRLINDLLTYSRISTRGKSPQPTDSHTVLGEALRNLQAAIEESGAMVTNDDLPTVRVDPSQLLQVFQNLIANAIKFRGECPPRIHVAAQDQGREWLLSVRDNGIGIDPQFADKLFVIFRRLHTRQDYPGTGIGLAICKRIVERHGGRIWVDSELGKGSTFYLTIPK
jgi:PAS domain S-box-containing protein